MLVIAAGEFLGIMAQALQGVDALGAFLHGLLNIIRQRIIIGPGFTILGEELPEPGVVLILFHGMGLLFTEN